MMYNEKEKLTVLSLLTSSNEQQHRSQQQEEEDPLEQEDLIAKNDEYINNADPFTSFNRQHMTAHSAI